MFLLQRQTTLRVFHLFNQSALLIYSSEIEFISDHFDKILNYKAVIYRDDVREEIFSHYAFSKLIFYNIWNSFTIHTNICFSIDPKKGRHDLPENILY